MSTVKRSGYWRRLQEVALKEWYLALSDLKEYNAHTSLVDERERLATAALVRVKEHLIVIKVLKFGGREMLDLAMEEQYGTAHEERDPPPELLRLAQMLEREIRWPDDGS